jgi:LysR family transcriptional regulator, transcriptional activator for leuABCD operon
MFNLRSLDLNLLTVFEAIYELGTVSAAADRLALSQSATSHALSRLRESCKDDLFVRAGQGLSPTPIAREMYPPVKQALEALRATLAEASGFDPARSQRHFRISIPHPMGPFYALDLRAAAAAASGVVLTFDTVSRPIGLEDDLRDGIVDVAIDWLPIELNPFINQKIFDDRLVLLARGHHPTIKPGVTLDGMLKAEFVAGHRRREIEQLPQAIREFYKLGAYEAARVSELLEIPTVVASTDLIGMFVSSMESLLKQRLGLQVLPIPIELPAVPIYMVWHEARRNDAGHRWLRELVVTELVRFAQG